MEKEKLFSFVAIVCILFFYSIPSSKRSVYLMPSYPFIAIFLAQYMLYITEYRTKATRLFAAILAVVTTIALAACAITMFGWIDPVSITAQFTDKASVLENVQYVTDVLSFQNIDTVVIFCLVLVVLCCVFVQLFKKINIKILYATIALTFSVNILIDGVIMKSIRKGSTAKTFAAQITKDYPLDGKNMYVMNNLKEYRNLYGLNFYLGNRFHNFETQQPGSGYFFAANEDFPKIVEKFSDHYTFEILETTPNILSDIRDRLVMSRFKKK